MVNKRLRCLRNVIMLVNILVNGDFESSAKCWICDNTCFDSDVKVRDHCHITGKYRGSIYRHCNIKVKLNHKISFIFHNLKNYDSHFII